MIRELVETESNYLIVLNDLKYKFMQPMEKLLKEEIKVIFPRIKELVDIHKRFLDKLKEATEPNAKLKLSSVFLDFREQFLIYGDYCAKLTDATDTLRDVCKRSSAVEQFVAVSFMKINSHSCFDNQLKLYFLAMSKRSQRRSSSTSRHFVSSHAENP